MSTTLHEDRDTSADDQILHDEYQHIPGSEPFPPGSPEALELDRVLAQLIANDAICRKRSPKRREGYSPIRDIASSRKCSTPKGLLLADETGTGTGTEIVPVPCRACPGCRLWDQTVDVYRLGDLDPVVSIVSDDEWGATRQRLARRDLSYMQVPLPNERRALITDASWDAPAEPVEDLAALLADLDSKRDRTDKRKVSSGRLKSRKQAETEIYGTEDTEPVEREVVGFWNTRMFADAHQAGEWLAAACDTSGASYEPSPLGVIVTANRHSPEAEKLWQMLKVHWLDQALPWYEGGPAPEPGDPGFKSYWTVEAGRSPRMTEPPMAAYEAWIPEVAA